MEIDKKLIESIIRTTTDKDVADPKADRDALESVVSYVLHGSTARTVNAEAFINAIRRKKIEDEQLFNKRFHLEDDVPIAEK